MRNRWFTGLVAAAVVLLLGCFGTVLVDLSNSHYSTGSTDSGYDLVGSQGYVFVAGLGYQRYALARVHGGYGTLSPGSGATSWGYGVDTDQTASPAGWAAFTPGGSNVSASSVAFADGVFYLTGAAAGGAFLGAGFGRVAEANGAVSDVKQFSPRDKNNLGGYLGDTPGGDIFVLDDTVYVFGHGSAGTPQDDIVWVAQRELDGSNTEAFGDSCGAGCRTGFSTLITTYNSIQYADTAIDGDGVAYSVFRASDGTEGRIYVTDVDLSSPGTAAIAETFEDGSSVTQLTPRGIAVQSDGKLIVAGFDGAPSSSTMFIIRYNADGSRDSTFGTSGRVNLDPSTGADRLNDVDVMSDGKIVVVGAAGSDAFSGRLLSDGTWDTTYSTTGYKLHTPTSGVAEFHAVRVAQRVVATGSSGADILLADL
ncbi:hypothetical protein K2Z84_08245 [Candidatus Binatia bacterium]|nr:hypothetical protein [Candidatus Binatia bacterium]